MTWLMENTFPSRVARLFGYVLVLGLVGCATNRSTVEWDVDHCCSADVSSYRSYAVEYKDVPGFLEKYLAAGVAGALGEKGLVRDDKQPDVTLLLSFSQKFFGGEAPSEPYFGGELQPGGATSFLASIRVEMRDTRSGELVWSGHVSRIHHLPLGGELSQAHKLEGIRQGFRALFRGYPARPQTTAAG